MPSANPTIYTEVPVGEYSSGGYLTVKLPPASAARVKKQDVPAAGVKTALTTTTDALVTNFGGFCQLPGKDSLVKTVQWRISNNRTLLMLQPLFINNSVQVKTRSLLFQLPSAAISRCVTVIAGPAGDSVLIDAITESNVQITLDISLRIFLDDLVPEEVFNPSNFYDWCSYSLPYSFDDRKPFFLKSLSSTKSIAGLIDGGLLLLTRSEPLGSFLVVPFSDNSYVSSFTSRLFGGARGKDTASEAVTHITVDGVQVSSRSILDAVLITQSEPLVVTISVDKQLKVWSIDTMAATTTVALTDSLPQDLAPVLITRCVPTNLLKLISGSSISAVLPIGTNYIKVFEISPDGAAVEETTTIDVELPNEKWLFNSYDFLQTPSEGTKLWMAWQFGEGSLLQNCEISTDGEESWATTLVDSEVEAKVGEEWFRRMEYTSDVESANTLALSRLLDGFVYNDAIVSKGVYLFNKSEKLDLTNLTLKQQVLKVVTDNLDLDDYLGNLKRQWLRFDNVCAEVAKQTRGLVSICYDSTADESDPFLFTMKTMGLSVVKRSSPFAILAGGSTQVPETMVKVFQSEGVNLASTLKLIDLLSSFRAQFSSESIVEVEKYLFPKPTCEEDARERMSKAFEDAIKGSIDSNTICKLLEHLNTIPDCLDCMQFLTKLPTLATLGFRPLKCVAFGNLGDSLIASNIRTESLIQREIVMELLLVVLTVDISDPMVDLFINGSEVYRSNSFNLMASKLTLDGTRQVTSSCSHTYSNLPELYLASSYDDGALIKNSSINALTIDSFSKLFDGCFRYYVFSVLLAGNADGAVLETITPFLDQTQPISIMLKGLVQLKANDKAAYDTFHDAADAITEYTPTAAEESALSPMASTSDKILSASKVEYSYNLCRLFESQGMDGTALKFAMDALATKNELKDDSDDSVILAKIFELSLKLNEFNLAYETILKMEPRDRDHPIKQFIYKLFQTGQLSKILEFQFTEDFDTVDALIYGLGESSALSGDMKNALKYYRTCYSLRLKEGDFRAAVEALYRFNSIALEFAKVNKYRNKQQLVENYLAIFNLLSTLEDDDRWVIRPPVELGSEGLTGSTEQTQPNTLVTFDDLQSEYQAIASQ